MAISFPSAQASHEHALETLNVLGQHIEFMRSIDTMIDVGCGSGMDLEWWATQTIEDDEECEIPLDIDCNGIDLQTKLTSAERFSNISYNCHDFEEPILKANKYDVVWCHDAFQYAINPLKTLANFHSMLSQDGMLCIVIPQTTNVVYHKQEFDQPNFQYFNYTLVSLIHMLAISGFDCKAGFFKKSYEDPWIHAIVYKSDHAPMDPRTTSWYDLLEKGLLPVSAERSINRSGHLRQCDLVLPWLDRSNIDYNQQ